MIHQDDLSTWAEELKDFSEYIPIKIFSLLQFFQLKGRCTTILKQNLEPINCVEYAVYSPQENRYYLRTYRNYSVDELYFYPRRTLTFSGESNEVETLRRYVYDGNCVLLLSQQQFSDIQATLKRLWKSQFTGEGVVRYKNYIDLIDQSLKYENYREYSSSLTGYKTVCNQYELRLKAIWDEIYKSKDKK